MDNNFKNDYKRMTGKEWKWLSGRLRLIKNHNLRFAYYGRKGVCGSFLGKYFKLKANYIGNKHGIEINYKNIDSGLSLLHAYNITINPSAKIGKDMTIFKGATIGSIRSGIKSGTPTIGDRVTICCNAFVCGNITIGNDVLIASNSFVNFDVPDNSIVFGNPGIIKHKDNPSKDYL